MTLVDRVARERIAKDLESTLIVEAAAGTGKTTALVERILSLLSSGKATLSSLVAVTFTEKAAGEMKLRLRTEIERARRTAADDGVRAHLNRALRELEAAHIGTIHAFCADLLRERPVEAEVDPLFEVASEDEGDRLYDEAFTRWFQATLAAPGEGVSRVLRRASRERDQDGPRHALWKAGRSLLEQRDFPTPYSRPTFDRKAAMDEVVDKLRTLGDLASKGWAESWLTKSLIEIRRVASEIDRREDAAGKRDHDAVEALLRKLAREKCWGWKGSGQWFNKQEGIARQEVLDKRAAMKADLERMLVSADADLAALLFRELWGVVEAYEELKARSGKLDFLDLLLLTRDLLAESRDVRGHLQQRFTHLLVDEFQDTDPLQAQILMLLAADDPAENVAERVRPVAGKLFLVGDPKQSIYRFRRADVSLYESIKGRLIEQGASLVHLTTSFRSAPAIQSLVNAAFEPLMKSNGHRADGADEEAAPRSQAEYVPLAPHRPDPQNRPAIVALPVPKPYSDYGRVTSWKVAESLPDAVGAFVAWLIDESGWTVTERGKDEPQKITSRHVCLLFKRLQSFGNDVTRPYVRALEVRRIPHVLVGGKSFHEREEVIALRAALAAIEWPDDTLSVYAALHGPFFALSDDALLAFRHKHGHIHPLRKRDPAKMTELTAPVGQALDALAALHRRRNRRPIADSISQFLETTRAHAGVAIWPAGEQALGNILRVLDMARRFEQGHSTSFRAFVARLEADAERGGANEAPVVEEGTDGVRIMTVHKAKGLEFPIVVLVDPTASATHREPSRYVDNQKRLWAVPLAGATPKELSDRREEVLAQDEEEAVRLLYVATTRARELLVVPVVGDERDDSYGDRGWLAKLDPVVMPFDRRKAKPAPGCPPFGDDSVVTRPENCARGRESSVHPGLHSPIAGNHQVVWWDPHTLDLDREDDAGQRQQKVLAADEKGVVAKDGIERHDAWETTRRETALRAAKPSLRVRTVTETKDDPAGSKASETFETSEVLETTARRQARPHGKRFGILVHAVLATVALDADAAAIADAARIQGRIVDAPDDEQAAARDAVAAALAHPLLVRARAAKRVERETAVMMLEDDGTILEGVVDLAFLEASGWTIVDFKTDVEIASRKDGYLRQVEAYARAIARATGVAAKGALLSV